MSSLSGAIGDPRHPVSVWLRARFPHDESIRDAVAAAAGPVLVPPVGMIAFGTQNIAIDWWIRFLVDRQPDLRMALNGVMMTRGDPAYDAGMALLEELGAVDSFGRPRPLNPKRFVDREEDWWARTCYALAIFVRNGRGDAAGASRLAALPKPAGTVELLSLANSDEINDLKAMRRLAMKYLLPALPAGRVTTGATFDGSRDLAANADLIVSGTLLDIKTTRGIRPRGADSRAAALSRSDIDQLLGYVLMDYSDTYRLDTVGIYGARFGCLATWPVNELCATLAGDDVELGEARNEFKQLLRSLSLMVITSFYPQADGWAGEATLGGKARLHRPP